MKKSISHFNIALIVISILFCAETISQNTTSDDLTAKIAKIKTQYKDIKAKEKSFKIENITNEEEGMESTTQVLKAGKEVKIIKTSEAGGDCGSTYEVYYFENKPFFVFFIYECFIEDKTTKTEKRFYIDNGKLIQFLDGKKNVKSGSDEFKAAEAEVSGVIESISDFLK